MTQLSKKSRNLINQLKALNERPRSISEGGPIRVLHVDDNACFLKTAKAILEVQGTFQVDTASCVEEAWEKMKEEEYDAVVSDYQMPGRDGLQFLKELRQKGNSIPFIVFTGKDREEVAIKALNLGATQYLSKTGDPEAVYCELAHGIQQAAKRSRNAIELKKAERRLFDEHARLLNIFSASPSAIVVIDLNGKITECNEQARKLFGYQSRDGFIGKNGFSLIADKDRERAMKNVNRTLKQGLMRNIRYSVLNKDGHERLASVSASVVQDPSGNPSGFVIVAEDITKTQRTADDLLLFSTAVKESIDGVIISDLEGKIVELNDAAVRLYGADEKTDLIGKNSIDLLPEEKEKLAENMKEAIANGYTKNKEVNITRKDGTGISVEVTTTMIEDDGGNPTGFLGIVRDITERKKTEQVLRASLERYRSFVEVTEELGWTTNADGEVVEDTTSFRKFTGQTYEEVKGWGWSKALHRDHLERATQMWKDATRTKSKYETEYRLRRHDGVYRYFMARSVPVLEEDGSIREWVGTCIDITDLKDIEDHLKEMNKRLEAMNEKLHVVGGLTRHDVRNKLSAVTGNAYLLRQRLAEDPKALEQLTDMEAAVRMVERIFEFASNYEKLGVEELACVGVGKAVEGAVSLFSDLKGVKIVNECHGLTVLADSLLTQLVYNLVDNSLKYGEKIRQVKIYYRTLGADQLELVFEDDGVGIPNNMRSNLFKEGFTSGKGTGYGLFMIKRICGVYGWTIRETGKQGTGAQFTMSIPKISSTGKTNYQVLEVQGVNKNRK